MVRPSSKAKRVVAWQRVARFPELPIGESALGAGAVRHPERAGLQGFSRSICADGRGAAGAVARRCAGRQPERNHDLVRGYEDSAWCKQEFSQAGDHAEREEGFRYVIARVDESEITGLAATKLWIDFSKQHEGPRRSGLLSLLYGLHNQPLPPAAVKLAAQVDEQMRDGLFNVKAAREAGDAAMRLASARHGRHGVDGLADADLCGGGRTDCDEEAPGGDAGARPGGAAFPKAVRPKQLHGLALARSETDMRRSWSLASCTRRVRSIRRRWAFWRGRGWIGTTRRVSRLFLLKSRDLYRRRSKHSQRLLHGHQRSIKSLLAGEKETAAQLAERVQKIVGEKAVSRRVLEDGDRRRGAAVAGRVDAAAKLYQAAVFVAPMEWGNQESILRQGAAAGGLRRHRGAEGAR